MTCEPHVRKALEEELALERLDAQAALGDPGDLEPRGIPNSPYPDPPPVVDPETATVTRRIR